MPKAISKAKEEEMSSALIAQLLAEDAISHGNADYYAEYSNDNQHYENMDDSYEDNSEDDFDPKKKGRINTKKEGILYTYSSLFIYPIVTKRGRKRKSPPPATVPVKKNDEKSIETTKEEEKIEETPSKKPRKPVPEGYNTGVYTELEEKNFTEGLELFGRDWIKVIIYFFFFFFYCITYFFILASSPCRNKRSQFYSKSCSEALHQNV